MKLFIYYDHLMSMYSPFESVTESISSSQTSVTQL
jgi:hypothetical protein